MISLDRKMQEKILETYVQMAKEGASEKRVFGYEDMIKVKSSLAEGERPMFSLPEGGTTIFVVSV